MKTKTILITLITMLAVTALVFQSCKKDDKEDPTPPIYTNGQGEIGEIGGTVKIDDPSSPINGASIVIPEGALTDNTTISIVPAPEDVSFPGDSTLQLIAFEPEGLEFEKPVQITLPFNGQDLQKARVYYYEESNDVVSEMPLVNTNQANRQVVFETDHFSYYTACEYLMVMKMKMVYNNQALKIGAMTYIDGWNTYALGGGTFYPGLQMIPVKKNYWLNYGSTVEYVVKNADIPLYSHFTVKLYDDDFFFPFKQKIELYIKREKVGNSFTAYVYKYNETGVIYNTEVIEYDGEEGLEVWFTGKPLIFYFDNFEFNPDDEYWIKTEWHMAKESDGNPSFTAKYELNNKEDKRKPRDMELISNDDIYNNYIDSEYVDGSSGNQPPYAPNNESPDNNATGVSVNTNLSWTCSDPDGDELYYDIYFGTNSNPPKVADHYTSITYDPGTLAENTTYYWKIRAFEVDNNDHSSHSSWSFTTADGGGGNTPPTALFTVSPSSGTTSTNFAFDASGSSDNEDPTSNLQVRWDFDGNGSWDTGWDTDKTESHQYSSENTYNAKLEVKDTEGLTDQYTKSITVSNGGGGNGCEGQANLTYGGQTYEIVEIGNQCWMAENLNYETTNSWWYDNSSANGDVYGRLYTWEAALTACPNGWSLPSDDEWKTLEMTLGMSQSEADNDGWRGTNEGEKMKSTSGWNSNGNGTNSSGFTALPGGYRYTGGSSFYGLGRYGRWWSSTENSGAFAWYRDLYYDHDQVSRGLSNTNGFSVRCLKD